MKYRLLDLLVCPQCGGGLKPAGRPEVLPCSPLESAGEETICAGYCAFLDQPLPLARAEAAAECGECFRREWREGVLLCGAGHEYPIREGIPELLPAERDAGKSRTAEVFGYEWLRYRVELPEEERTIFLAETQTPPSEFKNRLVLDAGCGMGRFTRIAAELGGEVVALDLSPAVQALSSQAENFPHLHPVRGDLLQPPFRAQSFDLIYSLGVLHHTPDTRTALHALAPLLKPGGTIAFWVYGRAGKYQDFRSNPLEPIRARFFADHPYLHFPYWAGVRAREAASDFLRFFTTRLPAPLLYYLCLFLVPLGVLPLLKYFTFSVHPDWRVRWQENFDWLSPPFQFKHTKEEVRGWLAELKLVEESILSHGLIPKVGFKARRK